MFMHGDGIAVDIKSISTLGDHNKKMGLFSSFLPK
jgi:hypothetical protein